MAGQLQHDDDVSRAAYEAAHAALEEFVGSEKLRVAMEAAANSVLEKMGVDTEHPAEMRKDMVHLRTWREFMEFIRKNGVSATLTWLITGVLGIFAAGVVYLIHR